MAMSFAAADPAFEKPYLDHSHLPCPAVELRVTLVAAQAICYSQVCMCLHAETRLPANIAAS